MVRVYLETSLVSALVTDRTDPASLYRRDLSRDWWQLQRQRHELFVSAEVIAELSDPRYLNSMEALEWIKDVPLLSIDIAVLGLARILVRERVMPAPEAGDAMHVAVACIHSIDFMLS